MTGFIRMDNKIHLKAFKKKNAQLDISYQEPVPVCRLC
jgi:hypothetical protein